MSICANTPYALKESYANIMTQTLIFDMSVNVSLEPSCLPAKYGRASKV
jgi:hypothetical protein